MEPDPGTGTPGLLFVSWSPPLLGQTALQCLASTHQTTWGKQLPWIEYAHNSLTSSSTGVSPFEAS